MRRSLYSADIQDFLECDANQIIGTLTRCFGFGPEAAQLQAWEEEIRILQATLQPYVGQGRLYFEYAIPRLGSRIDVVAIIRSAIFVLEFKVGERVFTRAARDQVWDYALDLKNFHETSHDKILVPVLIATHAADQPVDLRQSACADGVFQPVLANVHTLPVAIGRALALVTAAPLRVSEWEAGRYKPTPTIIEAAIALYAGHGVAAISRGEAEEGSLNATAAAIERVIADCRTHHKKAICFVTGVPGAGKTLIGLNIATMHAEPGELHSVFLSGNGPLVRVMQEALARDQVRREREAGRTLRKGVAASRVKAFVQNVHHFRDEYLRDPNAPTDHIAVFDEAQRAWNLKQTAAFMERKKKRPSFGMSEPGYLISCMDRHKDWAVIVCLVGGGQEINTGEGGISEWLSAAQSTYPHWEVHISPELTDAEYGAAHTLQRLPRQQVHANRDLHLAVSMRSFRAEHVSTLVKRVLDIDLEGARSTLQALPTQYPIYLCRNVERAKRWLREQARGSERYGLVVSSQAQRLRAHGIHVKAPVDPIHWFLHEKEDVRSSYYLEDVATEFLVQGLELDWTAVIWDGDLRRGAHGWEHFSFVGAKWKRILAEDRKSFQKNAYRVLLTRARQGMVIVVPEGDPSDPTRAPAYYDPTFAYLRDIGFPLLQGD